jgi:hypothetical protein
MAYPDEPRPADPEPQPVPGRRGVTMGGPPVLCLSSLPSRGTIVRRLSWLHPIRCDNI